MTVFVTDSRLGCVRCGEATALDAVWCDYGAGRALCLACYGAWCQERRAALAAEAEQIANQTTTQTADADGSEWE
jgi:hypothetical protein